MTHALRVAEPSGTFRSLIAAVDAAGERAGWLDLDASAEESPQSAATSTLDDGAWKAVAVEPGRTVTLKRRRGPTVLRDLLREHFRGCRVVLVRGDAPLPTLWPRGLDWELRGVSGERCSMTTAELVRALRGPHLPV